MFLWITDHHLQHFKLNYPLLIRTSIFQKFCPRCCSSLIQIALKEDLQYMNVLLCKVRCSVCNPSFIFVDITAFALFAFGSVYYKENRLLFWLLIDNVVCCRSLSQKTSPSWSMFISSPVLQSDWDCCCGTCRNSVLIEPCGQSIAHTQRLDAVYWGESPCSPLISPQALQP